MQFEFPLSMSIVVIREASGVLMSNCTYETRRVVYGVWLLPRLRVRALIVDVPVPSPSSCSGEFCFPVWFVILVGCDPCWMSSCRRMVEYCCCNCQKVELGCDAVRRSGVGRCQKIKFGCYQKVEFGRCRSNLDDLLIKM